jgi:pyridoxamine 5'-phosphate oxidase
MDNANEPIKAPTKVADLRVSYELGTLAEADLAMSPQAQFDAWFHAAQQAGIDEPNAMVVGTVGADRQPSARTVLLKGVDKRGFTFFTNLGSTKSQQLSENPGVSLVFPWYALHRQVVISGTAELLPREEVAEYFISRPHDSQIGAWVSRQSTRIDGREELDVRWAQLAQEYPPGSTVPVPDFWGGWLVRPHAVEFWQGRTSRLHDRLRFVATTERAALDEASAWTVERLSP